MINILYKPDSYNVICENENSDAELRFENGEDGLDFYIKAEKSFPKLIILRWEGKIGEPVRILGDAWERSYGDLSWRGIECERFMPWYFDISNGKSDFCYGVKTGCSSFVSFLCDDDGITAFVDVRCGTKGVELRGRELHACTFMCEHYADLGSFESLKRFCRAMCPSPLAPEKPVYGGNNWYYAYGKSSREEIISDTGLQVELARGLENRPFMVIDDCWQINSCSGPCVPNDKFGDMASLASEIKEMGARPGLWVRFLQSMDRTIPEDCIINHNNENHLDPSKPEVLKMIEDDIKKIRGWGYELIKHDFSTFDMFGCWGFQTKGTITKEKELIFADKTKTNAEIVLNFYKTIRRAAGNTIIIGCNTISHLSAGLVELNRIGDDTSGRDWKRTRKMGVNTLAFRLCQHKAFYDIDADCVGILDDSIPWELNRQWLSLLSKSGSPLFVSCPDGILTDEETADLKEAYKFASEQKNTAEPIDWLFNNIPSKWKIDGEEQIFNWNSALLHVPDIS